MHDMNDTHDTNDMNDMNDRVRSESNAPRSSADPELTRALDDWGRRERQRALDDGLADRVFAASRSAIGARSPQRGRPLRQASHQVSGRPAFTAARSAWRMVLPARVALAAGVLAALLIPAMIDLGGGRSPRLETARGIVPGLDTTPLGGTSSSEPLLLAIFEPDSASWDDVAGHEPGVVLYAVLESGRAGLDDYLSELDAIFGTFEDAGEGM